MSKLDLYVKLGSKLGLVLFILLLAHAFSGILGSFGIISDFFTVAGAVLTAKLVTDQYTRQNFLDEVDSVIDLEELVQEIKIVLSDLGLSKEDEELEYPFSDEDFELEEDEELVEF